MQGDQLLPPALLAKIYPGLEGWVDVETVGVKATVIGGTFVMFLIIFILSYLGSFTFETFKAHLRTKEKVFWCLAFVRAVFGFIAASFGFWYLAVDSTLHQDVVNSKTFMSTMAVYMCVGFFLFECFLLFSSNIIFRNFDPFLALHHSLSLVGFSIVVYYGKSHFFAVVGMLLEVSTPFTCLCWMLLKAKMSHLLIWKANQFLLVHLFHCRSLLEGYFFYKSYFHWDNIWETMPGPIMFFLYTQLSVQFFLLTPYWTYKKSMQMFNPVDWNHERPVAVGNGAALHGKQD